MKPICHVVYSAAMIGKQFIQKSRLSVLHKLIFAVTSRPIFCAAVYCTLFFTPLFKLVTTIWTRIHRTMVGKRDFRSYLPMFMEISFICALIIHYMYLYSMFTQCFVYSKFLLLRSVATLNPRSGVSVERCIYKDCFVGCAFCLLQENCKRGQEKDMPICVVFFPICRKHEWSNCHLEAYK